MAIIATISTDTFGRLTKESALTVDGVSYQIPERVEPQGHLAPARICAAIRAAGYQPDGDYYKVIDSTHRRDGYITVDIVPVNVEGPARD
jgi:hypothetical protein